MNNWQTKNLSELCNLFADGDWIEKKDQSEEGIRLIQTGNVGSGYFKDRAEKARYISEKTFKRLNCTEILPGDCFISRLPDPVGRACIIPDTGEKMITAVDCTIIRFKKDILPKWFINYSLSNEYQRQINKEVGGATRQRISRKNLGQIAVPLPPLPEQKRIVKILDETFEKLEKAKRYAEKNLVNSGELFESYLNQVFSDSGKGWKKMRIGDFIKLEYGKPLDKKDRKSDGKYPVYGANGEKDRTDKFYFDKQTIIVGRKGSAGELNLTEEKFWPLDVTYFVTFDDKKFNLKFIYFLLLTLKLTRLAMGVKPGINRNDVYEIEVLIPEIKEQKSIVKKLDQLSEQTKKLESIYQNKLSSIEELKKSILSRAFSKGL